MTSKGGLGHASLMMATNSSTSTVGVSGVEFIWMKMMRMVAVKMTDAEIKAVADYVAGLR